MFDLFGWLRRKAAEAVIGGVSDGVKAITPEGEQPPTDLNELRAMLAASVQPKQLPPAKAEEDDEAAPTSRKKEKAGR